MHASAILWIIQFPKLPVFRTAGQVKSCDISRWSLKIGFMTRLDFLNFFSWKQRLQHFVNSEVDILEYSSVTLKFVSLCSYLQISAGMDITSPVKSWKWETKIEFEWKWIFSAKRKIATLLFFFIFNAVPFNPILVLRPTAQYFEAILALLFLKILYYFFGNVRISVCVGAS